MQNGVLKADLFLANSAFTWRLGDLAVIVPMENGKGEMTNGK